MYRDERYKSGCKFPPARRCSGTNKYCTWHRSGALRGRGPRSRKKGTTTSQALDKIGVFVIVPWIKLPSETLQTHNIQTDTEVREASTAEGNVVSVSCVSRVFVEPVGGTEVLRE